MLRTRLRTRGGGGGAAAAWTPTIPSGYSFVMWADGTYELDANGNYVITKEGN